MNAKILPLIIFITAFASCTTAYKASQTPDDVYYSPAPPQQDEVKTETKEDNSVYKESEEDRELRVKIRDRRWRNDNDYDYSYQPYSNHCCCTYSYNPKGYYYYPDPITRTLVTYYPRKYNFNTHNSSGISSINPKTGLPNSTGDAPVRTLHKGSGLGGTIRNILSSTSRPKTIKSGDDNSSTPVRTFDKSNSSSNNSSSNSTPKSSSSGNAPVRTFGK